MATRIIVPAAGQTTDELKLVRWLVSPGQAVRKGDVLAELETDKTVMELESHAEGQVLQLMASEGDTVIVGDPLLYLGQPGERWEADGAASTGLAQASVSGGETARGVASANPADHQPSNAGPLRATPAARTLARQQEVDLSLLSGSGPEGCIVKRDVREYLDAQSSDSTDLPGDENGFIPFSAMRRTIAARLQQSVREAPHFYVTIRVEMSKALALRERLNQDRAQSDRITINDMIVKAVAATLAGFPEMNCRVESEGIRTLREINLGLAVSVDQGLLVPVLAHADKLGFAELARQTRGLIARARQGRLDDQKQAGFTISNLGMYGISSFTAIINPPEAAILAVGAIEPQLAMTDQGIIAVPRLTLTLSVDHRAIDGALAARFMRDLRIRLESVERDPGPGET